MSVEGKGQAWCRRRPQVQSSRNLLWKETEPGVGFKCTLSGFSPSYSGGVPEAACRRGSHRPDSEKPCPGSNPSSATYWLCKALNASEPHFPAWCPMARGEDGESVAGPVPASPRAMSPPERHGDHLPLPLPGLHLLLPGS
ncbi:prostaglandin E synthase isoform X2 [Lemur catta]|uniref:prostaglandin E synthase isoform X2 n=1 Tax=Lemur catta TaxID=9447 RepID=UPI001E26B11F|nr:prostaglandin E synthase isoform X2 [Lemur catta]